MPVLSRPQVVAGALAFFFAIPVGAQNADIFNKAQKMEKVKKRESKLNMKKEQKFSAKFKQKKKKKKKAQPTTFDMAQYRRQKKRLIEAKRNRGIYLSEKLLRQTRDKDTKIRIKLRLAGLYMEAYDDHRLREQEKFNQAWKRYKKGRKPKLNNRKSNSYKRKAVKIYMDLYRNEKNHPQRDDILYFLGYLDTVDGFGARALVYFNELLTRFPRSSLVPEAELKVGDYYFKSDVRKALQYFTRLSRRRHSLANYGRYKMAWALYNLKRYDDSIRAFQQVVAVSERDKGKRGAFDLTSEALQDLVVVFAEADKGEEARAYFSRVGGQKYYIDMLIKLGDNYMSSGKMDQSINIYRELLTKQPTHWKAPQWMSSIIEAYRTKRNQPAMLKWMEKYAMSFKKGSTWAQKNYDRPDEINEAIEAGEFDLRKTTKEAHFLAQKTHQKADYKKANNLYTIYLRYYSGNKNAYEMTYFHAEALYQVGEFRKAGAYYRQVAKAGNKKKYYTDSTYGGIVAFLAEMEKGKKKEKRKKEKIEDLKPIPLKDYQEEFLELVDLFVKDKPKDPRALDLQYRSAYLCYDSNQWPCAKKRFNWVIRKHPKNEKARFSAHLILHWLNVTKNYTALANQAQAYLRNKRLGGPKFKKEMEEIVSRSRFKAVELVEAKGDHRAAAMAWAKLGNSEKKMGVADKALYKAAQAFIKANDEQNARKYYSAVVKRFPRSELAPSSTLWVASYHRRRLQVGKAAESLNRYVAMAPKTDKNLPNARYDIAVLFEANKSYKKAALAYQNYALAYPRKGDAPNAFRKSCEVKLKRKRYREAIACFERAKKTWPRNRENRVLCDGAVLDIYRKRRKKREARAKRKLILAENRRVKGLSLTARSIVGRAKFESNEPLLAEFNKIKLNTHKVRRLQGRIAKKLKLLNRVNKAYSDVLKYGVGDWGVPALYRLGNAYQGFAEGLINAPKPPGLKPEEAMIYDEELQKVAIPLDDKGRKHFEDAYKTMLKLSVYNGWSKRVYAKLNKVDSMAYPIRFEKILSPKYRSEFVGD